MVGKLACYQSLSFPCGSMDKIPGGLTIWSLKSRFIFDFGEPLDDTCWKIITTIAAASLLILVVIRVSFTGSNMRNSKLIFVAAPLVESVTFTHGRSTIVTFEDDDTNKAIEWIVFKCFLTMGRIFCATSHLPIYVRISTKFLGRLVTWCRDVKVSGHLEAGCYSWFALVIGKHFLILQLDPSKQGKGLMQVGFKVSNEGGYSIHKMSLNEMICNVEKGVLDPKNLSILWNLLLVSLHDMNGINGMADGNILAIIHSFEFSYNYAYNHHMESLFTDSSWFDFQYDVTSDVVGHLAAVIMILVLGNLKRFVWDPGRDFYGICMHCKIEAVVVTGPNREPDACSNGNDYGDWSDLGGGYRFSMVVLAMDDVFAYVRKEKQCCCITENLIIIVCEDYTWKHWERYASVMANTARSVFRTVRYEGAPRPVPNFLECLKRKDCEVSFTINTPEYAMDQCSILVGVHSWTVTYATLSILLLKQQGGKTIKGWNLKWLRSMQNPCNWRSKSACDDNDKENSVGKYSVVATYLENFVWDPDLHMARIFSILEDKDVLKGREFVRKSSLRRISILIFRLNLYYCKLLYDVIMYER